jgi:hypothetical protein
MSAMSRLALLLLLALAGCPSSSSQGGGLARANEPELDEETGLDAEDDDGNDDGGSTDTTPPVHNDPGDVGYTTPDPVTHDVDVSSIKPRKAPQGNGFLLMPDLTGMTLEQAKAALKAAGFKPDNVETTDFVCDLQDDRQMQQQGTVCSQDPVPDAPRQTRLMSRKVTLERDTYGHGGVGTASEWWRMPDLIGKKLDVARTILARASLPVDEHFEVHEVSAPGCDPGIVCETEPEALGRKVVARKGRIVVGKGGKKTR